MAVRMPQDQDELYRLNEKDGAIMTAGEVRYPFHGWSEPYLMATELPWKVLGAEAVKGARSGASPGSVIPCFDMLS
jgi:hypothetical protein